MLNVSELVNMTNEELLEQYHNLSKQLFAFNNELSVSKKLEKPHMLKALKKDRARILTAISQKKYNLNQR